jgi:plastocyanin
MHSRPRRSPRLAQALLFALCAPALAGTVTVSVANRAGAPAADTVIVFDPLDAMPPASHETAIVDQINKTFVPRVSVVRTGTVVTFPNSDNIRHQVYSFSPVKEFTLKLYAGAPKTAAEVFDKPGLVVLGCNIHDTMVAFVGVVDSPYFAKTPASGTATLDVPPGRYRLRIWNPNLGTAIPPKDLVVSDAPLTIPLIVDLQATLDAVAPWP